MKNINLKATLKTPENIIIYDVVAVEDEKEYSYHEKDDNKTKVIYNHDTKTLIRENKELRMQYIFKEGIVTKGNVHIKDLNKHLDLIVKTKNIKEENNIIEIEFTVENHLFLYKLEWEE